MKRVRYETFVPAVAPRTPWAALWQALRLLFAPQPRTPLADPTTPTQPTHMTQTPIHAGEFWNEPTPEVLRVRAAATEARQLMGFYLRNEPTSRRYCMAHGMTDGSWRRARKTLARAGVISRYDGRLLYAKRAAQLKLDVYLDEVERRCRESGRYVAP